MGAILAANCQGFSKSPYFQLGPQHWDTSLHLPSTLEVGKVCCHETWAAFWYTLWVYVYVSVCNSWHNISIFTGSMSLHTSKSFTPAIHASDDQFRYFIKHCCCSSRQKRKLWGLVWFFGVLMCGLIQPFTSRDLFKKVADLMSWSLLTTASSRSVMMFTIIIFIFVNLTTYCLYQKGCRLNFGEGRWRRDWRLDQCPHVCAQPWGSWDGSIMNKYHSNVVSGTKNYLTEDSHLDQVWKKWQSVLIFILPGSVIQLNVEDWWQKILSFKDV